MYLSITDFKVGTVWLYTNVFTFLQAVLSNMLRSQQLTVLSGHVKVPAANSFIRHVKVPAVNTFIGQVPAVNSFLVHS